MNYNLKYRLLNIVSKTYSAEESNFKLSIVKNQNVRNQNGQG